MSGLDHNKQRRSDSGLLMTVNDKCQDLQKRRNEDAHDNDNEDHKANRSNNNNNNNNNNCNYNYNDADDDDDDDNDDNDIPHTFPYRCPECLLVSTAKSRDLISHIELVHNKRVAESSDRKQIIRMARLVARTRGNKSSYHDDILDDYDELTDSSEEDYCIINRRPCTRAMAHDRDEATVDRSRPWQFKNRQLRHLIGAYAISPDDGAPTLSFEDATYAEADLVVGSDSPNGSVTSRLQARRRSSFQLKLHRLLQQERRRQQQQQQQQQSRPSTGQSPPLSSLPPLPPAQSAQASCASPTLPNSTGYTDYCCQYEVDVKRGEERRRRFLLLLQEAASPESASNSSRTRSIWRNLADEPARRRTRETSARPGRDQQATAGNDRSASSNRPQRLLLSSSSPPPSPPLSLSEYGTSYHLD